MRDYWLTRELLSIAGWGYLLLAVIAIGLAVWLPKQRKDKLIAGLIALGLFSILPIQVAKQFMQEKQAQVEASARLRQAQALFEERCETAGEKIYKTVENVEGVLLMNTRQSDRPGIQDNPLWPDAALPHEATGDEYIRMFLYWEHDSGGGARGFLNPDPVKAISRGYQFVDVKQADGTVLRYRLKEPGNRDKTDLVTEFVKGKASRYAVDFVNQVNPEDRAHWIAGTTITLTDTQASEVIATRESYSFEVGLGSKAGARQPWAFAITCPSFSGWDGARTRFFVDQVLKPKQGE